MIIGTTLSFTGYLFIVCQYHPQQLSTTNLSSREKMDRCTHIQYTVLYYILLFYKEMKRQHVCYVVQTLTRSEGDSNFELEII